MIPGKKRVWRQGPSPARPGVWMQARAAVPNLSACSDDVLASQLKHSPLSAPTGCLSMIRKVSCKIDLGAVWVQPS